MTGKSHGHTLPFLTVPALCMVSMCIPSVCPQGMLYIFVMSLWGQLLS